MVFNVNKGEFLCENDIRKDEKCQQKIPHLELDSLMRLVFFNKKINKINSYVTLCGKRITTSLKSISRIKMPVVDFSSF